MIGRIFKAEKCCKRCPIRRPSCQGCKHHYEMASDRNHVYCTHPDADVQSRKFDTDTGVGLKLGRDQFLVLVQRGDLLWAALLADHPAVGEQ